ncbi:MAG: hypothetical protein IMZ59_06290 [Actinobacteria bacterium]|nr:hypothetical protein [Actinomycetota bacterium]
MNDKIYKLNKIMYSFRIDKKLLNKAKKEDKILGLCTSVFTRQAIIDKVSYNNKLKELEDRIVKLENKK